MRSTTGRTRRGRSEDGRLRHGGTETRRVRRGQRRSGVRWSGRRPVEGETEGRGLHHGDTEPAGQAARRVGSPEREETMKSGRGPEKAAHAWRAAAMLLMLAGWLGAGGPGAAEAQARGATHR